MHHKPSPIPEERHDNQTQLTTDATASERRSGLNRRWIKAPYNGAERRSGKDRRGESPRLESSRPAVSAPSDGVSRKTALSTTCVWKPWHDYWSKRGAAPGGTLRDAAEYAGRVSASATQGRLRSGGRPPRRGRLKVKTNAKAMVLASFAADALALGRTGSTIPVNR